MALLTFFIVYLMSIPYVQFVGSALLLWIGIKLLMAEDEAHGNVKETSSLMSAIKIIIIADIVMSLDNVLAMAGAAKGHVWMLVFGLIITIPVVLFGSALLMKIMDRFPITVVIGAGLIGYVAGEMMVSDPSIDKWVDVNMSSLHVIAPIAGAILVVVTGKLVEHLQSRKRQTVTS
jgi:YjbE family integral membrane protein